MSNELFNYIKANFTALSKKALNLLTEEGFVPNDKGTSCIAILEWGSQTGTESKYWAINETLKTVDFDLQELNK